MLPKKGLFFFFLLALAGCSKIEEPQAAPDVVTVDFLEPLGLKTNGLAPQIVCADSARNRVFAACANSSALAVVFPEENRVSTIPIGSRMPRRLRNGGMAVSGRTGKLFLCGRESLIMADPESEEVLIAELPGDFEAIALDEKRNRAWLAGRTRGEAAVVNEETGTVRLISYTSQTPPLPFMAASAPPSIRFPFIDENRNRIYILDGCTATLFTIDGNTEKLLSSRKLPVEPFPRWHAAGFSRSRGLIYAALENERRQCALAVAVDVDGADDVVVEIPKGHTEPAGVTCDPDRGELYIPYDNNELIHLVTFGEKPEATPIALPQKGMGVDAADYDPSTRTLYAAGWMQAALYMVDMKEKKRTLTVPFFPVYPHMNSMALNRADGKLYVPSGSTAVNGTFGSALSVFDPRTLTFSEIETGWAPVSLVRKPGAESFYVFGAEKEFAEVSPDGAYVMHSLPHPYPREAIPSGDGESVLVAYGPHSSMWPNFYISGTRNGIWKIGSDCTIFEDTLTPRLVQGMVHDKNGRLWILQNTWGNEEPFLICYGPEPWSVLRLPPKVDNECLLRLLAIDEKTGLLYAGRTGNLNSDKGLVHVIDPDTCEIKTTVEVGRTPTGICVLPHQSLVCVTNFDDDTLSIIKGAGDEVAVEPTGRKPIAVDAHAGTIYVANHLGESLSVFDGESRVVPLPPGALPNNILADERTGLVYITAHAPSEARVYCYDPEEDAVKTIHTASHPYGEVTFDQANAAFGERGQWGDGIFRITDMAFDKEGRLWITDYLGGKLWILNRVR